ncbi:MAG: DEAD/DEAH box helicase family protein [Deltaproteobacteria bacterium]|nr:DEAD/DEAH box helicase family protein [Deltaproteobacteria bacterium]
MNERELIEKCRLLLDENSRLKEENNWLKARLGLPQNHPSIKHIPEIHAQTNLFNKEPNVDISPVVVTSTSDSISKIKLFMSLFKGREDVFATRWENKKKGTSGYAPVCNNQWRPGLCGMPKTSCAKCANKAYAALNEDVIEEHLRGNIVVGIYPMLPDETCCFLAIDFDEGDWQRDISVLRDLCMEYEVPVAVERSRSGKGGHTWFFFETPIPAALARRFGAALLTSAMNRRHEIRFNSYDRLFPSQDTMPKGGFGNLIALPFQKTARKENNSEFVDESFCAYEDQWAYLSSIQKIHEDRIKNLVSELGQGHELGVLKVDEEDAPKPWERHVVNLSASDFPGKVEIVKANMLFIPKKGVSQRALNRLKRLASFKNPMFFRQQAMHLPTYGHPVIISCADETGGYLCLPRGCETELSDELKKYEVDVKIIDKTNHGKRIAVEFKGDLRDEQARALDVLLQNDIGILSGTTAFGKTVVAIKLIAERKVNTLILVDRVSLLSQWKDRLSQFLTINELLPETNDATEKKRGRRKKAGAIGWIGAGRNNLSGIVDIAVMQSLSRLGEVKACVKDYGMIIADECHHAPAFRYENILKTTDARYVCGLTATPARKDGHHPILIMHCGPIRYRDNPKTQARMRPFGHYIIPRFTTMKIGLDRDERDVTIQDLYSEIIDNEMRNQQIVEDVLNNYRQGRNCIILSQRIAHVELLAKMIKEEDVPDVFTLTGGMGAKTTREVFQEISGCPETQNLIIVATGAFIGEGFDEPRLDTLFLAMPISWKGTLQQYAGRLHRLFENKKEVRIYDYADIHIRMLEKMYQKRLSGYASMGYRAKAEDIISAPVDIIFDRDNFLPVFCNDMACAKREILIVSPYITKRRTLQIMAHLKIALDKNIRIIVVTRPVEDFKERDRVNLNMAMDLLEDNGIKVVFKSNIHQKFSIMDQRTVWYGSINLLSYGSAQESIMRIESPNIANELVKTINGGRT